MFIQQLLVSHTVLSERDTGVNETAAVSAGRGQSLVQEAQQMGAKNSPQQREHVRLSAS